MISNPTAYKHDSEGFVYEGGSTLYHFSPHDNGWSTTMECNIIFFANSKEHAKDVLWRMFDFCIQELGSTGNKRVHKETEKLHTSRISWYLKMRENLLTKKVIINEAPTDQVYKVGWARNDNIK